MKNYTKPYAKVTEFDIDNIITASGVITNAADFSGADLEMYNVYKENAGQNENISVFTW